MRPTILDGARKGEPVQLAWHLDIREQKLERGMPVEKRLRLVGGPGLNDGVAFLGYNVRRVHQD
ncbi:MULTISPECIES: hypothetical protein [unclassified Rhizobium]|uniref:hypothetical protein n=1 Tax=unclassified Rhizobium TaxID=2613769 RepID=UPI001AE36FED|nr:MULTISPECIES: hypothetical protein [unclassified Rhizobium]MBP2460487.1 hypothetical protein [Rhizobium sp. PvP014]MBP2527884.1 hypothetical protein [Rhizobium sp. PvP099]